MRFTTVATVLLVVALVITDVSAGKSNRDKKTVKNGKQKQSDFRASRQKEERVDDVMTNEKKARQMLTKERKRRSIEEKEPTYERKENLADRKKIELQEDKEKIFAKSEVKQFGHQFRNKKTETNKKFGNFEKLRKSKTIAEDALGGAEDYLPNSKKSVVKRNFEKSSKTDKSDILPEEQVVRSTLKKDKGKNEKSKITKKDKITEVEEEAKTVVKIIKKKKTEKNSCVEGDFTCNDEVVKNSKKSTCNENNMEERVQKKEMQPEDTEEFENYKKSIKSKTDKYAEKKQKQPCNFH